MDLETNLLNCIAIGWLSNLMVAFYVSRCIKNKLPIRFPFGCEKCMGFWIGCLYFINKPIPEIIIFASITSLSAVLTNAILKRVNGI